MMRAGYAVTRAAYRPLGLARKNSGRGGARSFAGRHAARGFAAAVVDDDRGHTRGRDAIDQAIGLLVLVAGHVAGEAEDRKRVVEGQSGSGRVAHGGRRGIKK